MARCCGGTANVNIEAGANITVTGIGSSQDPFVISTDLAMEALDTATFDVTVLGSGTAVSPWQIKVEYASTASLGDIPDVDITSPTNGQVLAWNTATSSWKPANPTTASAGSVNHDTTLSGDGSVGSPMSVVTDTARYLQESASGVGVNDSGINQMVRKFADNTARTAASPAPTLNTLSMVNTAPGVVEYWNGSAWVRIEDDLSLNASGNQLLSLSGAYVDGTPVTLLVRNFTGTTDTSGVVTVLPAATLSGKAGVLSATVTPTGSVGYSVVLSPGSNYLAITARRLDDGALLAGQALAGQVVAYVY